MLHEILNAQKKKLGLDIDGIVEKSGVPKGTVSKIMAGTTPNPSIENVKAIAYALGLTLSDLDDRMFSKNLSDEEQSLLVAFRSLDTPGKSTVMAVIESQQQRINEYGAAEKRLETHSDALASAPNVAEYIRSRTLPPADESQSS